MIKRNQVPGHNVNTGEVFTSGLAVYFAFKARHWRSRLHEPQRIRLNLSNPLGFTPISALLTCFVVFLDRERFASSRQVLGMRLSFLARIEAFPRHGYVGPPNMKVSASHRGVLSRVLGIVHCGGIAFPEVLEHHSADLVIIHQDSFAADYQDEEYTLFGKAIKFAGLHGKEIRVIGKNRETLTTTKAALLQ